MTVFSILSLSDHIRGHLATMALPFKYPLPSYGEEYEKEHDQSRLRAIRRELTDALSDAVTKSYMLNGSGLQQHVIDAVEVCCAVIIDEIDTAIALCDEAEIDPEIGDLRWKQFNARLRKEMA